MMIVETASVDSLSVFIERACSACFHFKSNRNKDYIIGIYLRDTETFFIRKKV